MTACIDAGAKMRRKTTFYSIFIEYYSIRIFAQRPRWRSIQAVQCTDEDMAKNQTEGLQEPMTFQADGASRRKKGAQRPVFADVFQLDGETVDLPTKVHLLVNPYAGKKRGRDVAKRVIELVEQAGVGIDCSYSAYSGHLVTMASALVVDEHDIIAVVGGDGSLSEVISGRMLLGSSRKETFAVIPAGTGNSHAHDLRLSSVEAAVEAMLRGHRQALDLARVELTEGLPGATAEPMVRYSHNLVTWGLGVDSTIQAEKMRWMGPARYDVGILLAILANRRRTATLTLDDRFITDDFTLFLVQNTQTGGSMLPLAPGASTDDGLMDIGILKKMSRRDVLKAFGMLKKEGRHVFHPRVDYHRFTTLKIETEEPTAINIDGENIGSTPLSMSVLKHAAYIMRPA